MSNYTSVITTVGVSMFTNYFDQHPKSPLRKVWNDIKSMPFKESDWDYLTKDSQFRKMRGEIIRALTDRELSCAEWQTLERLKTRYDDMTTYLVSSDTISGYLAGTILQEVLPVHADLNIQGHKRIEGFDVLTTGNKEVLIKEGFGNYLDFLVEFAHPGTVLNISGGYKAIIPITTLIASYRSIPMYYNFEASAYLVEFPPFPFTFDFQAFAPLFERLESATPLIYNGPEFRALVGQLKPKEKHLLEGLILKNANNETTLSILGTAYGIIYETHRQIELVETKLTPPEKPRTFAGDHHGNNELDKFARKILKSPYVTGVITSIEFNSYTSRLVNKIYDNGQIELTLHWTDSGYGMLIQTTGRNKSETDAIGEILEKEYSK